MSISSIYILDKKGNILINRNYKADTDSETIEKFQKKLLSLNERTYSPFIVDEENNCMYTIHYHANLLCKITSPHHLPSEFQCADDC